MRPLDTLSLSLLGAPCGHEKGWSESHRIRSAGYDKQCKFEVRQLSLIFSQCPVLAQVDVDGSGFVEFPEFCNLMYKKIRDDVEIDILYTAWYKLDIGLGGIQLSKHFQLSNIFVFLFRQIPFYKVTQTLKMN